MIRPAGPQDAAAVAAIHRRAWRDAHPDSPDEPPDAPAATLVWDQHGMVAGYAGTEGNTLTALAVDPPAQNSGVGTALVAAAVEEGAAEAWLADGDERARRFFGGLGWSETADRRESRTRYEGPS